jgi:hypothetical protein
VFRQGLGFGVWADLSFLVKSVEGSGRVKQGLNDR